MRIPVHVRCGRVHLGPVLHSGGGVKCYACGVQISEDDREQINRSWTTVHAMLAPYREKQK